ncbi:histidine kinase dimerization/phospho-acceptor domain-containing protein [Streptomyces sp. NPDC056231]|uniref:HAMP domain-containing sensor histidine kinase n=1 Tax=Streptomyces sp. NPDC056231 TaxID=3345755 RepID=UPI003AB0CF94
MRQRVVRMALVAALVALVLLAVPLALVIRASFFADERGELERDAMAAVIHVSPDFAAGDPVELPPGQSEGRLGVYDTALRLRAGTGPSTADTATRRALAGAMVQQSARSELVAAVPVSHNERVIGVVRAAISTRSVWNRILTAWAALLAAALVALGAAILVARRQARALTAPLESLSRASLAIADGDLSARAATCGINEIDHVADTHNAMVQRLAQLLHHEKNFTANASHQLRTPLTGLQLGLEQALTTPATNLRAAIEDALEHARHLNDTIDEVLQLAQAETATFSRTTFQPVGELLERAERRWHGPLAQDGRRIRFTLDPAATSLPVPGRTTEQILEILLNNAHRHGRGTVTVTLRDMGAALAVDVTDEGNLALHPKALFERGTTTGPGEGIGLALAKDLADTAGARLSLTHTAPTTFTLLLPHTE